MQLVLSENPKLVSADNALSTSVLLRATLLCAKNLAWQIKGSIKS